MNLEEAAAAHIQWKLRLKEMVAGSNQEALDPEVIGDDAKCALGQWIHGEAENIRHLHNYHTLVREHKYFHKCAAKVVRLALSGHIDQARMAMGNHGEMTDASNRIVAALKLIQQELNHS